MVYSSPVTVKTCGCPRGGGGRMGLCHADGPGGGGVQNWLFSMQTFFILDSAKPMLHSTFQYACSQCISLAKLCGSLFIFAVYVQ